MNRLRALLVAFAAIALIAGPLGLTAQAGASGGASASASAAAKKKCKKFKGKKKRQCLKNAGQGKPGKGGKPWAGSNYRPGLVCSLSLGKQRIYAKYGLICIDVGFGVTTLTEI